MPTYEYACTSCGQHIEAVQSFTDEPLTTCAVCGAPLRKVFGAIGIVLKGSGFYKTDSRPSAGGAKSSGKEKEGAPSPSEGEGSKSAEKVAASTGPADAKSSSSSDSSSSGTSSSTKAAAS